MEIFLAYFALIFAISDLIGQEKALKLEQRLVQRAKGQLKCMKNIIRYIAYSSKLSVLFLTALSASVPYFVAVCLIFIRDDIRLPGNFTLEFHWLWLIILTLGGVVGAFFAFFFLLSYLPRSSRKLRGQPERWIAFCSRRFLHKSLGWYERVTREEDQGMRPRNPYGSNFPVFVGPLIAIVFFPLSVLAVAARCLFAGGFGGAWLMWGVPVMLLKRVADFFENPSYFHVAKYLLLVLMFVFALLKK